MSGGVKLRRVVGWVGVTGFAAVLALGHVWKQNTHARLSRELVKISRERDARAAEVLLLDTEARGLRHFSRLEAVARERLGLVKPGPAVVIQPAGQVVAAAGDGDAADGAEGADGGKAPADTIRSARWKGFFR
jgi:cell division protein FtsL